MKAPRLWQAMSAAEAAAAALAGKQGATLQGALAEIQKSNPPIVHPALIEGWKRLYAFSGDSGGIRHALKEGTMQPDQDLAQYFVVTCSAFVNFVAPCIQTSRRVRLTSTPLSVLAVSVPVEK